MLHIKIEENNEKRTIKPCDTGTNGTTIAKYPASRAARKMCHLIVTIVNIFTVPFPFFYNVSSTFFAVQHMPPFLQLSSNPYFFFCHFGHFLLNYVDTIQNTRHVDAFIHFAHCKCAARGPSNKQFKRNKRFFNATPYCLSNLGFGMSISIPYPTHCNGKNFKHIQLIFGLNSFGESTVWEMNWS